MKTLTLFDFDDTLIKGSSLAVWNKYLRDKKIISAELCKRRDQVFEEKYNQDITYFNEYIAFALLPIVDMPYKKAKHLLRDYGERYVAPLVFEEAKTLLGTLLADKGNDVVIISKSINFILQGVAKALGIRHTIATQLVIENDHLLPVFDGTPSFGEGKLARIQMWLTENQRDKRDYEQIVLYADSTNDLALCEFVDSVYAVNPSSEFEEVAEDRGWDIIEWGDEFTIPAFSLNDLDCNVPTDPLPRKMNNLTIFDLDDTLVKGDSSAVWRDYLVDKGIITDPHFVERDKAFQRQYVEGMLDLDEYLPFWLTPIATIPASELERMLSDCIRTRLFPRIFPEAKQLVKQLSADGGNQDLLIISASISFIVAAVARELGIPHSIGMDLAKENGCYTSKLLNVPSFREGKVTRLQAWLAENDRNNRYKHITFYTDSINDLPLCEFVDHVFVVNPCEQLLTTAQMRGWRVLSWGESLR